MSVFSDLKQDHFEDVETGRLTLPDGVLHRYSVVMFQVLLLPSLSASSNHDSPAQEFCRYSLPMAFYQFYPQYHSYSRLFFVSSAASFIHPSIYFFLSHSTHQKRPLNPGRHPLMPFSQLLTRPRSILRRRPINHLRITLRTQRIPTSNHTHQHHSSPTRKTRNKQKESYPPLISSLTSLTLF